MTTDPIGGVWQYTLELCREFGRRDMHIVLASMGRWLQRGEKNSVSKLDNVELVESAYKLEWMNDPWHDVTAAGEWLMDLAGRHGPRVIHLNQFSHGNLSWNAPALVVGHSCVYSWFEDVKGKPPDPEWQMYVRAVRNGLHGADLVTAPSHAMLSALLKHYGSFTAAAPVYNGRSSAVFFPRKKEPFIFSAGRLWDEAKNIAVLQSISKTIPWLLYAAGDNRAPDGKQVRLSGVVELGRLESESLGHWLSRAAVFVLPARYEPFGLSVLEAALSGCALVVGDIASLRELWNEAALFVHPDDPEEILAALGKLTEDSSLREQMSLRARTRALTFSPQRMAQGYLDLYQRLETAQRRSSSDLVEAAHCTRNIA
jgi:glycosyltransferase involved in cell wall biosynthesis